MREPIRCIIPEGDYGIKDVFYLLHEANNGKPKCLANFRGCPNIQKFKPGNPIIVSENHDHLLTFECIYGKWDMDEELGHNVTFCKWNNLRCSICKINASFHLKMKGIGNVQTGIMVIPEKK